jgi:hypothetical protein
MTLLERPRLGRPGAKKVTGPATWSPPALRRAAPILLAMLVSGVLHVVWWQLLPSSGGDIAAQDAWAGFARSHPDSAYNLAWYGGMHPVSYSVISPYLMAAVGVRPTLVVAGTLAAGLLAWLIVHRYPTSARRMWPALYGALALVGNAVSGRATFALGTLFALAALCVVFAWPAGWGRSTGWRWCRGVLTCTVAALATAASPVAGLFLGLVAVSLWLGGRRAAAYAVGLPPVAVVVLSAILFPFAGLQPMSWFSAILPVVAGASVVLLVPQSWRTVRVGAAVYVVAVVVAWLVPSPIGTNVSRLGLLFGGVVLVAVAAFGGVGTSIVGRRFGAAVARNLLVVAVLTCTVWQVATAARDAITTSPPASWSGDLAPLIEQLEKRDADLGRVEIVPTKSHREAVALAPYVNLARGWNRQADAERNWVFYRDQPLTATSYHRWLHRWAVQFVVLSPATPDPAALAERELVASGLPYLKKVWAEDGWTIFEVRRPTPLVSPPATVLEFNAAGITLSTPRAGPVVVRIPESPWLSLVDEDGNPLEGSPTDSADGEGATDGACLTDLDTVQAEADSPRRPDDWLVLQAPRAGIYRIAAPYKLPRGTTCP